METNCSEETTVRPLLINFMFLVTRPHVILMAASIGHYWWRYVIIGHVI